MTEAAVQDPIVRAACPRCHRPVRVPAARLDDGPRCPACKSGLFPGTPVELDDATFDRYLGHSDLPVLVDFWAPWCGPCRTFAPVLAELATDRPTTLLVVKVNTDAAPALAARFGIRSIPTVALFRGGREIARQNGALPYPRLLHWIHSHGIPA